MSQTLLEFVETHYHDGMLVKCAITDIKLVIETKSNPIHESSSSRSIFCGETKGNDICLYHEKTKKFAQIIQPEYVKGLKNYDVITALSTFSNIDEKKVYKVSDYSPASKYSKRIVVVNEQNKCCELGTDGNSLYTIATKEEYDAQFKLTSFPERGYCQGFNNDLSNYLLSTRTNGDSYSKGDIGIAWSSTSYWYVTTGSSNQEYTLVELMPFICKSTIELLRFEDIVVDKWYEISFRSLTHYIKFKELSSISGIIDDYGYVNQCKTWSKANTVTLSQITSIKEVSIDVIQPFLPKSHPDWMYLSPIDHHYCEIEISDDSSSITKIKNPLKKEKNEYKNSIACKIHRSDIKIRQGCEIRGTSIRSSESKIRIGSDNSYHQTGSCKC